MTESELLQLINEQKTIDNQLDIVFYTFDENFQKNNFTSIDNLLKEAKPENFKMEIALGMLTVSFSARDHLNNYELYYNKLKKYLEKNVGEYKAQALLTGLKK